jgi:MFS family permease
MLPVIGTETEIMSEKVTSKSSPVAYPYAWVILVVVYLASIAAPLSQSKVPPILPLLMQAFQLNLTQAGLLMSVFAVTGLLLALPAGIILQQLGPKGTGLIALACLAGGSVLGAVSNSVSLLLGSRVIEGVGMGLLGVVAPASIAMWFPREKQGAPMGIWATWVPVGTVAMYLLAPSLATAVGWPSVWWVAAGYTLLVMLGYGLLMRLPAADEIPGLTLPAGHGSQAVSDLRLALANRDIWLLGLEFACFNLVFIAFGTFYPTFLTEVRGYPLAPAAWIASISTVMILLSAPLAGWLSDRIGSRRLVFSLPFLAVAVLLLLPFRVTGWQIYTVLALLGLVAGANPTATFAAAPEVMRKPHWAGMGLAVIMVGQNLGLLVGPVLFGSFVRDLGWAAAGYTLIPVCLLGFVSAWLVRVR